MLRPSLAPEQCHLRGSSGWRLIVLLVKARSLPRCVLFTFGSKFRSCQCWPSPKPQNWFQLEGGFLQTISFWWSVLLRPRFPSSISQRSLWFPSELAAVLVSEPNGGGYRSPQHGRRAIEQNKTKATAKSS